MIILRVFLYLICVISIGWSLLVFGGPPIIKRLISVYSEGVLIPSGITVSPRLDIGISQLEFKIHSKIDGQKIEGFSRATEIAWSLFGEKPFLEINLGPSVFKDHAIVDSVNFFTPSLKKIDWQTRLSYYGPESNAISTRKARIRTNTALSTDLFGENMTLTFKVNDIFETQKWRLETFNETYRNYTEASWRGGRSISFDLIYRFNQKKSQRNRGNYQDYGGEGFGN